MPKPEHEPLHDPDQSEPLHPSPLPPDMADFLRDLPYACLTEATDIGTILVLKAPAADIRSARGRVPILLRHDLYCHPQAPVIRMTVYIYDQPERPLAFEMFVNVGDPQQRAEYAQLAQEDPFYLLFYDETLRHRLTKGVHNAGGETIRGVLSQADSLRAGIPQQQFDFDAAKKEVMRQTHL